MDGSNVAGKCDASTGVAEDGAPRRPEMSALVEPPVWSDPNLSELQISNLNDDERSVSNGGSSSTVTSPTLSEALPAASADPSVKIPDLNLPSDNSHEGTAINGEVPYNSPETGNSEAIIPLLKLREEELVGVHIAEQAAESLVSPLISSEEIETLSTQVEDIPTQKEQIAVETANEEEQKGGRRRSNEPEPSVIDQLKSAIGAQFR